MMSPNRTVSELFVTTLCLMILMFTVNTNQLEAQNFCSTTAAYLSAACSASANDSRLTGIANCINHSDSTERQQCLSDVDDSYNEDIQLCRAQHRWRLSFCTLLGEDRYDPNIEPSDFDTDFTNLTNPNPYYPLGIGNHWKYVGGGEVNTVDVTNDTKLIDGVRCIVVKDQVFVGKFVTESTNDWFAQKIDGTTWYFGEETGEYETFPRDKPVIPELVDTEGSFKAGRDEAKPGIIFLAQPKNNATYFEEFALGTAEDVTQILSINYSYGINHDLDRMVPKQLADHFCSAGDCVVTKNISLLEPQVIERKYYARRIGVFLEVELTAKQISRLVECNFDSKCQNIPQP